MDMMEHRTVTYQSEIMLPMRMRFRTWRKDRWLRLRLGKKNYEAFQEFKADMNRRIERALLFGDEL